MREIRTLRSTWRGLETWDGRDGVTLADERARQQGTQTSTYTGAPVLDPTSTNPAELYVSLTMTKIEHLEALMETLQTYAPQLEHARRRNEED